MLPTRWRDVLSLVVAGFVIAASAIVWYAQRPDTGFTIVEADGRYVVGSVTPGSEAAREGVVPGSIVSTIDESVAGRVGERDFAIAVRDMGDVPDPVYSLLSSSRSLTIETSGGPVGIDLRSGPYVFSSSIVPFLFGLLVLVGGAWWMKGGRAGAGLSGLAIPFACASAVPLLAAPVATWGAPLGSATAAIGPAAASLLLGDAIAALIARRRRRIATLLVSVAAAAAAAALPLAWLLGWSSWADMPTAWWALLLVSLVPMLVVTASRPLPGTPLAGADNPGPAWLIAASCAPAVAAIALIADGSRDWAVWLVIPVWILALVVGRAVGRSLARSRLQRNLVVTVAEAERARLAAELHDVALQELTLLVRRLDASGDAASATMARSVSERLRELCGELHLPILDELGAGPALEWLVGQVGAATGEEVRLERADQARPPAAVELAIFRVAQEAISNAVKHGGPPIVVRYVTGTLNASLSVDDAGPGLDIGRGAIAPRPGHYGLATMQQRAELIGALLSIRAWPGGGTRVSLEWKAS
jgi:signal transduction histidine kinase